MYLRRFLAMLSHRWQQKILRLLQVFRLCLQYPWCSLATDTLNNHRGDIKKLVSLLTVDFFMLIIGSSRFRTVVVVSEDPSRKLLPQLSNRIMRFRTVLQIFQLGGAPPKTWLVSFRQKLQTCCTRLLTWWINRIHGYLSCTIQITKADYF